MIRGEINLSIPHRATRMPPLYRLGRRPVCVLVGDDDYQSTGPAGWACALKLRAWAAHAIVHGARAIPEHYAAAASLTIATRRLLLIETSSAAADDWGRFLNERADLPIMGILCSEGPHSVMPARGELLL